MPLKNSLGVERRIDLASLFCMIGRHGPAVALAIIAMVSVLAGFVIYRNVRGKRRKAEVDASEGRSRGEPGEESGMSPEREARSAALTDESDEEPCDVQRNAPSVQSDFTTRKRHVEKKQPLYSPPGRDIITPAAKKVQSGDTSERVKSFSRGEPMHAESVKRDDDKAHEREKEEMADGWTTGTRAEECGPMEAVGSIDEQCSEKEEESKGFHVSDLQEENKFEQMFDKLRFLDRTSEDVIKQDATSQMVTSQLLREEPVDSSKDGGCDEDFKEQNNSQDSSGYDNYNGSADTEEERSSHVNTEEKSVSGSHATVELQIPSLEQVQSETPSCQDISGREPPLERDLEGEAEPLEQDTETIDECVNGEQVNVSIVEARISDLQPGQLEEELNNGLQRGTEEESVNGLTVSDEELEAHVKVPSSDLDPEPAGNLSCCEVGSIVAEAKAEEEEEESALKSTVVESCIEAANGHIPAIVLHEVADESPKSDFDCHFPDVPIKEANSENSSPTDNEPEMTEDSTAVLDFDEDLKSEPLINTTSDSSVLEKSTSQDHYNSDLKTSDATAVDDGGVLHVKNGSVVNITQPCSSQKSSKEADENDPSSEGPAVSQPMLDQVLDSEPIECDSAVVEEASASSACECENEPEDEMDWKTSDETCVEVAASETAEGLTSDVMPHEDLAGRVTTDMSAMTLTAENPPENTSPSFSNDEEPTDNIAVISETQVTQTTLYADDVAVYVAKVERKLESYALNEDTLGHEIEDRYQELAEKLMVHVASTVATLTNELADRRVADEKKEGGSGEKKGASTEKDDEEEVHEKTEISIMEATMDHNEWITDGSYQTLPWMNLPIQTKTDRPEERSLMDNTSMDVDVMSSSGPGLVDENTDNGKKIVAVQPMPQNVSVTFRIHYVTHSPDHSVAITGNQQELGNWKGFVPLEKVKDGQWMAVLSLPAESLVEWKFVVVEEGEVYRWEECRNRLLDTGCGDDILVHKCWGFL